MKEVSHDPEIITKLTRGDRRYYPLPSSGTRFGRLVFTGQWGYTSTGIKRSRQILQAQCRCDCGNICWTGIRDLRSGATSSCGCFAVENRIKKKTPIDERGDYRPHLYEVRNGMIDRCYDP